MDLDLRFLRDLHVGPLESLKNNRRNRVNDMVKSGRGPDGRWLPGYSGNACPPGRPIGSRQKLAEQFIKDAYELWKLEGPAALLQMRREDNSKFVQVMAGLIPRDLVLTVEADESPFAGLSPEEKRAVAQRIYDQLAAENAKVIDGSSALLTEEQSPQAIENKE